MSKKTVDLEHLTLMLRREAYAIRQECTVEVTPEDDPDGLGALISSLGFVRTPQYAVMVAFENLADRLEGKR